jgi:hypothetical protein
MGLIILPRGRGPVQPAGYQGGDFPGKPVVSAWSMRDLPTRPVNGAYQISSGTNIEYIYDQYRVGNLFAAYAKTSPQYGTLESISDFNNNPALAVNWLIGTDLNINYTASLAYAPNTALPGSYTLCKVFYTQIPVWHQGRPTLSFGSGTTSQFGYMIEPNENTGEAVLATPYSHDGTNMQQAADAIVTPLIGGAWVWVTVYDNTLQQIRNYINNVLIETMPRTYYSLVGSNSAGHSKKLGRNFNNNTQSSRMYFFEDITFQGALTPAEIATYTAFVNNRWSLNQRATEPALKPLVAAWGFRRLVTKTNPAIPYYTQTTVGGTPHLPGFPVCEEWNDQVHNRANLYDFTQTVGSKQPTVYADPSIGNKDVLWFNYSGAASAGTQSLSVTNLDPFNQAQFYDISISFVAKFNNTTTLTRTGFSLQQGGQPDSQAGCFNTTGSGSDYNLNMPYRLNGGSLGRTSNVLRNNTSVPNGSWGIWTITWDGTGDIIKVYCNKTLHASFTPGNLQGSGLGAGLNFVLGNLPNTLNQGLECYFAEVIMNRGLWSATDHAAYADEAKAYYGNVFGF